LTGRVGVALRALFVILLLVPVGALFLQSWRSTERDLSVTTAERAGINYVRSLNQLTLALTGAQSAAVAGWNSSADALTRAMAEVATVDQRYGEELRTRERWSGLQAKIAALRSQPLVDGHTAYGAYVEVTDLLLDLYAKVRESSGLIRDPGVDSYFLQEGAAKELPEVVIAAGRLADLMVLASRQPASQRMQAVVELVAAQTAVAGAAGNLTQSLRAAVDGTQSGTLTQGLLGLLDAFQQNIEQLPAGPALLDVGGPAGQTGRLSGAGESVRDAATKLSDGILAGLDGLIVGRANEVRRTQRIAIGATVLAGLLILAAVILPGRRGRRAGREHRRLPPASGGTGAPRAPGADWISRPGEHGLYPGAGDGSALVAPAGMRPDAATGATSGSEGFRAAR
jgi:hypothetical protein